MANQRRQELLEAVTQAIYASSTAAVFFHTAIAEQIGLGPTEEKTLLLLSGSGSHTAGEIARHTGLTTASVTDLIDRLERKGFVRRVRDTKDRRRVIVEPDTRRLAELAQVFGSFQGVFTDLLERYSDEQLVTITDYLNRAAHYSRETITKLSQQAENHAAQQHDP
jgi:DNA-binding MarR family transcriptional regulator